MVEKFIFPIEFIKLDMEEDNDIHIIVASAFLNTEKALIDMLKC